MQSSQSMQVQLKTPLNKEEKKKLEKYMKKGNINKQPDLRAYLVIAITEDNVEMVQLLLRTGININESLQFNNRNNINIELLASLIKSGQYIKENYIEIAMDRENSYIFNLFVQMGAKLTKFDLCDLVQSLKYHPENKEKIKRRIDAKVNLNQYNSLGYTPLYYALQATLDDKIPESIDIVKWMLAAGADPNMTSKNDSIFRYILSSWVHFQETITPLYLEVIKMVIQAKVDVNNDKGSGKAPLSHAVCTLSSFEPIKMEIIKLLIGAGANVNISVTHFDTLFNLAVYISKSDELAKFLINSGLKINYGSNKIQTPLHSACLNLSEEIVQLLLNKGADINAIDRDGRFPFHAALENPKLTDNFLIKLLPNISNIDSPDDGGCTILYWACVSIRKEIINILLDKGANPKNIPQKLHEKLSEDVKKLLVPRVSTNSLTETATKIVSRLMRNINGDKKIESLTPEVVTQLRQTIIQSLTKPGLIDGLVDDNDPEVIQMRADLASFMQNDILSCIHGNSFDKEDIICAAQEAVMLWKGKKITSEKEQNAAAEQLKAAQETALLQANAANRLARANVEAAQVATQLKEQTADAKRAQAAAEAALSNARAAERIYSTSAAKQTLYAPPQENRTAAKMNAAANIINAVARLETGLANNVNAFNNALNP